MDTLNKVLASLSQVRTNKENAKDRWLAAMQEGSDDMATLKQAFLQADDAWTNAAHTLAGAIVELQTAFCFELALSLLDTEETYNLHKMVAELHLDHLTDPYARRTLNSIAVTWYRAEGMREAAQTLHNLYRNRDDESPANFLAGAADNQNARKPQEWALMVQAFHFIHSALKAQSSDESEEEILSSSLHFLNRHLLRQYDDAVELLSEQLEDVYYGGNLSGVLVGLDIEVSRALQDAVTGGLIRQRQPQAEEQRETRTVSVAERLEAEDAEEGDDQ